ncbi:MAG TPA: hypothetical protein VGY14_03125 [Methyloceanibacter sp.]|nr:hypothetical protein [Methyloceanibacter sp.]
MKVGDLLAQLDHEMHSLAAATRTAEQKVLEAEGVQKSEIERERAEWALELGTTMRDHAKAADQALAQALQHYMALRRDDDGIEPDWRSAIGEPIRRECRRALVTVFQGTPFAVGFLAPNERHTLVELSERWSAGVQHFA